MHLYLKFKTNIYWYIDHIKKYVASTLFLAWFYRFKIVDQ